MGTHDDELGEPERANDDYFSQELERQARETMQLIRESAGDLGARVRQALNYGATLWESASAVNPANATPGAAANPAARQPAHETRDLTPDLVEQARALARRWVAIDFLVDSELPSAMRPQRVESSAVWLVELRERGETRALGHGSAPYTGERPKGPGPTLPVWDYTFATSPEIASGERRERIPGTEALAACAACNGTGHRACATCEGGGFVVCPQCHGKARLTCPRCHGRARVPDPDALRKQRSSKSYVQVQAERLMADAGDRIADVAERLRQDYGVPLPPSTEWAPSGPADAETMPCPDCVNGTIPCSCGNGKRVCATCHGTGAATCAVCAGTGQTIRYNEVVRRFDTRIRARGLPPQPEDGLAQGLTPDMLRKATQEEVWAGDAELATGMSGSPSGVPAHVWAAALALARASDGKLLPEAGEQTTPPEGERRVVGSRLRLLRVPVTRVEYTFTGKPYSFLAVGARGSERFWADSFPPRWGRVGRFLTALARDLNGEADEPLIEPAVRDEREGGARISNLDAYRVRQATQQDTQEAKDSQLPHESQEPRQVPVVTDDPEII